MRLYGLALGQHITVEQAVRTLARLVARLADGRALGGEPGQYG